MIGISRKRNDRYAAASVIALAMIFAMPARSADVDPVAFAKQVVEQAAKSVMSRDELGKGTVKWTGAESSPPPIKDATIAVVPCPLSLSVCQASLADATAAAEAMGWKVIPIDSKGDPAVTQQAVDAAINRDVKCVFTDASPSRDIRAQIARGKEKGIAFVTGFSDDPREFGGDIGFGLDQAAAGKLLAAYVVAQGGGDVVMFTAPAFPQLAERLQGFKDYLAEHGGGTAKVVEEVEFNVGAGAPDLITKTQALLTKYPKDSFKWILGPYDESLVPILATAKQRDRTEIKALGFDGEPVALESIAADGGQAATIAWGTEWIAWAGIDECNRALNKTEVGVNKDFPLQLIIKDNVTPGKRYDPGLDFKAEYRAMWDAAK